MGKAVFFDIDGTLVDRNMEIPDSTRRAIKKLHENGHYAFICSGRSRAYIKHPELLSLGFDGIISGCGTHVEAMGQVLVNHKITKELLAWTWEEMQKSRISPLWEGPQYLFADDVGLADDKYYQFLKTQLKENLMPIEGTKEKWDVCKMSVVIKEDADLSVFDRLSVHYQLLQHSREVAELVPAGFSKATGVEAVRCFLNLEKEDIYAIGDSINDLEMLKAAGIGICMGNGTPEAKEAADYVTDGIHDDGVWNALEHFGLI